MKKSFIKFAAALGGVLFSSMAFAQEGAVAAGNNYGWMPIGAGLAIGLAAFGAAGAQGRTAAAALESIGRNPSSKDAMFLNFILGLVFMEFQALLGFVIAFFWTMVK
jgi:F-type H+-transporting ATPase subunit c